MRAVPQTGAAPRLASGCRRGRRDDGSQATGTGAGGDAALVSVSRSHASSGICLVQRSNGTRCLGAHRRYKAFGAYGHESLRAQVRRYVEPQSCRNRRTESVDSGHQGRDVCHVWAGQERPVHTGRRVAASRSASRSVSRRDRRPQARRTVYDLGMWRFLDLEHRPGQAVEDSAAVRPGPFIAAGPIQCCCVGQQVASTLAFYETLRLPDWSNQLRWLTRPRQSLRQHAVGRAQLPGQCLCRDYPRQGR